MVQGEGERERRTTQIEQFEESKPYFNFINSIKSKASKKVYHRLADNRPC